MELSIDVDETAEGRGSRGNPVRGVRISWASSDPQDARFRVNQSPCVTGSNGACSTEIKDLRPRSGDEITVMAITSTASGTGSLPFQ